MERYREAVQFGPSWPWRKLNSIRPAHSPS